MLFAMPLLVRTVTRRGYVAHLQRGAQRFRVVVCLAFAAALPPAPPSLPSAHASAGAIEKEENEKKVKR